MSKRERDQAGYLLPTVIDPEDCVCVCVPIPNDPGHIRAFLGQLDYLGYWWTWERDPLKKGTEAAQVWRGIVECVRWRLDNDCGCGGGGGGLRTPTNERFTDTGELEVSFDGGETWESGDAYDPRLTQTTLPRLTEPEGDERRCRAANNVTGNIKQFTDSLIDSAGLWGAIATLVTTIGEFLIVTGVWAVAAAPLMILVVAIAAILYAAGVAAFNAAMTDEVYERLACNIYCSLEPNGDLTASGWQKIKEKAADDEEGLAEAYLYNLLNILGVVGIVNASRTYSAYAQDCTSCQCGDLNCGFISTPTENKFVWTEAVEKIDPTTFTGAINFQQSAGGNVMFGSSGATLAAYHEFEEACYITTVELYTSGRPNSSAVTVGYKATPGGSWINTGTQSFPTWASGVPKTFTINAPVYAIQVQSLNGNVANNNFTSIVVGDPTP